MTDTHETPLREAQGGGKVPQGDGWFIVNVSEAQAMKLERFGSGAIFEPALGTFPEFGINVRRLQPGQPCAMYHRENTQETFLVLSGECLAIVENQERTMRAGDFLYMPPETPHVLVGAGDGPSSVLMVGTRKSPSEHRVSFPVSEAAARFGASVEQETSDRASAYAGTAPPQWGTLEGSW